MFNLQRDGTRNGLPNIEETFAENVSSAPTHEHFPVFNAGLSSSNDGWTKFKEKVPDLSDPNQNVEKRSHSNSSLHNVKIYLSKGCRNTSQRWTYVAS